MHEWEKTLKVSGWSSELASVDRLLKYYARKVRSERTRETTCWTLKNLCEFAGRGPDELAELEPAEASRLVQGYVDSLAGKGYSTRYVNVCLAFSKTFFKVNGFKGDRSLEVERHFQPSRYRKRGEYIPTSSEIYDMALSAGSARNKAMVLALYTSGVRNSTLAAIMYRDVKEEFKKGTECVCLPVYAEMKKIVVGACKGNIPYYTFISKEAAAALRGYLDERERLHGGIAENEPLFACDSANVPVEVRRRTPVQRKTLDTVVKRAARRAGLKRWKDVYPHCLRKSFESALRNAGLDTKDQEFLMGHILPGSQDAYYDKTKTETLRRKYAQVLFFPERVCSDEDFRKRQILDTAKLLGFSQDKIKKVEEALAKYDRADDALDEIKKLNLESRGRERSRSSNQYATNGDGRRDRVKIVRGEQGLVKSLNEGWDLVRELSDEKFVLKRSFD
jgi:site-specific recombinase XerD